MSDESKAIAGGVTIGLDIVKMILAAYFDEKRRGGMSAEEIKADLAFQVDEYQKNNPDLIPDIPLDIDPDV